MEQEKANITVQSTERGVANVIITHLDKPAYMYDPLPLQIKVRGTLQVVAEFMSKRANDVPAKESRVEVNREAGTIQLHLRDQHPYESGVVTGALEPSQIYKSFGINTGNTRTPQELAHFFKMNRFYFADINENMKLVSALSSFSATVDNRLEKERKENGSMKDNFSAVVHSNIPPTFQLAMPIFKATSVEIFEVEFYANLDGRNITFSLVSPGANQAVQSATNEAIDAELIRIIAAIPNVAILEI